MYLHLSLVQCWLFIKKKKRCFFFLFSFLSLYLAWEIYCNYSAIDLYGYGLYAFIRRWQNRSKPCHVPVAVLFMEHESDKTTFIPKLL